LSMIRKRYEPEFKEQIVRECQEVGNAALVARNHGISRYTINNWVSASRKRGSVVALPRAIQERTSEMEHRLKALGAENDRLKRIVAEKELELAILRELRDRVNPR
jgi:transposase-like protein